MANPLKFLSDIEVSGSATFRDGADMNGKVITNVATGSNSNDAVNFSQFSTEQSTRSSADSSLTTRISTEESVRGSADTSLTTRVSTEESTRESADTSLTNRISTEESVRGSADTSLTTRISTEESVRASAVSNEASIRDSADSSLTTRLSTEESVRASAVSNEASIRDSADSSLTTRLSTEESVRASAVSVEASTRDSADSSLTTRVSVEESTRDSADTSLTTRLSTEESIRASAVSAEASTRDSADSSLTTRISTEESVRGSADTSLTTRVSTEESVRASAVSNEASIRDSADTSLTTRLSTEESTRGSADTSLTTRLSTEESVRGSADTSLTTRVSTEESARSAEDLTFLKLDGTRAMSGDLDMGTKSITNAKSASFSGDVTVGGNFQVNGTLTYINSTDLKVTDKLITVASGAVNAAAAQGAGFEIGDGLASFTFDSSGKFVSTEDMDLASGKVYKLNGVDTIKHVEAIKSVPNLGNLEATGSEFLNSNASVFVGGVSAGQQSTNAMIVEAGVVSLSASLGASIASANNITIAGGSADLKANAGTVLLSGSQEVEVTSQISLKQNVNVHSDVPLESWNVVTGSSWPGSSDHFDLAGAIYQLDQAVSATQGASVSPAEYYGVRAVVTASMGNTGVVDFLIKNITGMSDAGPSVLLNLISGMSFDVAVKASGSSTWTNDLVSLRVEAGQEGGAGLYYPKVTIEAPALAEGSVVRLIAVNETANVIS